MAERMLERQDAPTLRYWDDGGERPPLMLIHGVGADGTSWGKIASALSAEFRVLRLDCEGMGGPDTSKAPCGSPTSFRTS